MRSRILPWFCLAGLSAFSSKAAEIPGYKEHAVAFFEMHCVDCHDGETKKGGLDLTKLDPVMANQTELWTSIHDRIQSGEMPPKKRKDRPEVADIELLLSWMEPHLLEADRVQREVALRRLNRVEYRNTIRDLLGVDFDFARILPEDQKAGGFDNNGKALAVSADQMEAYLKAASLAVEKVLKPGEKPVTHKVIADPAPEVQELITKYPTNSYKIVDGMAAVFKSERSNYSQIASRGNVTKADGRYRFKFKAKALNTTDPLVFKILTNTGINVPNGNLGYFEVGPEEKTFVIEAEMKAYSPLQFFLPGLPLVPEKGDNPGIAFGKIEMTGPLAETWPPKYHMQLLGKLDLSKATAADAREVLEKFLPRAFRRPVEPAEVDRYAAIVTKQMEAGNGFRESLRTSLLAILCSPNFLYLREDVRPGGARINDSEFASRLSYFLWSTMPDAELFQVASENKLRDPATLRGQVERMLNDPKANSLVKNFTGQWLHLREINATTPDAKTFPNFDELLEVSMVREGEEFFRHILEKDLSVANFLDSDFAMLNGRLAEHYGIDGVKGMELQPVKLPPGSVRGGVITQAGVLKVTSNGSYTSPVVRGAWVLEAILGRPSPPPPPNINGIEPDIRGATTLRQQLDKHRNESSCASCHQYIDPPGFALESFDPTGALRTKYVRYEVTDAEKRKGHLVDGADVDATGNLADGRTFSGIVEFKKLLMTSQDDFQRCLTKKLLTYGLGRELGFSDRPAVGQIMQATASNGNGLRTLIHHLVASETFSTR